MPIGPSICDFTAQSNQMSPEATPMHTHMPTRTCHSSSCPPSPPNPPSASATPAPTHTVPHKDEEQAETRFFSGVKEPMR